MMLQSLSLFVYFFFLSLLELLSTVHFLMAMENITLLRVNNAHVCCNDFLQTSNVPLKMDVLISHFSFIILVSMKIKQ